MTIAVTGASGFLAGYVIDELMSHDIQPVLLSRNHGSCRGLRYTLTDYSQDSLVEILNQGVEGIVHLASNRMLEKKLGDYQDVIDATENLYEASLSCGIHNIVFTSSISVYSGNRLPYSEDMPAMPGNNYGLQKLVCEQIGNIRSHNGLRIKNLRLAHLYGANENNNYMINKFFRQAFRHEQLHVYARGSSKREMLYVKDAARAIFLALKEEDTFGTFNIGSNDHLTNEQIATMIVDIMSPGQEVLVGDAHETISSSFMDGSKAAWQLGYRPRYSFEEAVKDVFNIMKETAYAVTLKE